jgi:hypothetical protein
MRIICPSSVKAIQKLSRQPDGYSRFSCKTEYVPLRGQRSFIGRSPLSRVTRFPPSVRSVENSILSMDVPGRLSGRNREKQLAVPAGQARHEAGGHPEKLDVKYQSRNVSVAERPARITSLHLRLTPDQRLHLRDIPPCPRRRRRIRCERGFESLPIVDRRCVIVAILRG